MTLNYYYPYLLPVSPVYFDILLFMLKLCCVALPIDRSFSVFYYSLKMIGQDSSHRQTHTEHTYRHRHTHWCQIHCEAVLQIWDCPFTQCDKVLMNQILIHFSQQHCLTLNTVWTSIRSVCSFCTGQCASEEDHLKFRHLTFSTRLSMIQYALADLLYSILCP